MPFPRPRPGLPVVAEGRGAAVRGAASVGGAAVADGPAEVVADASGAAVAGDDGQVAAGGAQGGEGV
ncbi:hypothetical protein ACFWC8_12155, partial [Streptomyces roseolus]